ncbi:zinc finger, LIM-type protein [Pseudohyphozyma bogoriensis]|nr:zinc finger, LIM-type protein [Pseudohyphozyma bogoriensis]
MKTFSTLTATALSLLAVTSAAPLSTRADTSGSSNILVSPPDGFVATVGQSFEFSYEALTNTNPKATSIIPRSIDVQLWDRSPYPITSPNAVVPYELVIGQKIDSGWFNNTFTVGDLDGGDEFQLVVVEHRANSSSGNPELTSPFVAVNQTFRVKGGGNESTTKALAGGASDKWSQRYLRPSPSNSPSNSRPPSSLDLQGKSNIDSKSASTSSNALAPPAPPEPELAFAFGSVLSPHDLWECAECRTKFKSDQTIYPHPRVKDDPSLAETKTCKCAVLSDAPFVQHDSDVWHSTCYTCIYCDSKESPIIDFAGNPACEICFDSAAYKTASIPESPHLAPSPRLGAGAFQSTAPKLRPPASRWGAGRVSNVAELNPTSNAGLGIRGLEGDVDVKRKPRVWREREKSPMVPAFDELKGKLRKVGLGPASPTLGATSSLVSKEETKKASSYGFKAPQEPYSRLTSGRPLPPTPTPSTSSLHNRSKSQPPLLSRATGPPTPASNPESTQMLRHSSSLKWALKKAESMEKLSSTSPKKASVSALWRERERENAKPESPQASPSRLKFAQEVPRPSTFASHYSTSPTKKDSLFSSTVRPRPRSALGTLTLNSAVGSSKESVAPIETAMPKENAVPLSPVKARIQMLNAATSGSPTSSSFPSPSRSRSPSPTKLGYPPSPAKLDLAPSPSRPTSFHAKVDNATLPCPSSPTQTLPSPTKFSFQSSMPSTATSVAAPLRPPRSTSPLKVVTPSGQKANLDNDKCQACGLDLGYGEFVELPKTGAILHRDCFRCGGCDNKLDGGKHIDAEGKIWHKECAPAPRRYKAIVTSLREPVADDDSTTPSPTSPVEIKDDEGACSACGQALGFDLSVTLPRSGKSYHQACFRCAACEHPFGTSPGQRQFVEYKNTAYHPSCAPARPPSPVKRAASVRTSTSRASIPTPIKIPSAQASLPAPLPSPFKSPSIFSTRVRPPAGLGGLLVCAGCSVRATEKETVMGPKGKRYHSKCLVCGSCSRSLDSECRVNDDGGLRCLECRRMEVRRSASMKA